MLNQLAKNIGKGKNLESLPYCALTENHVEVVSGHHRCRAARKAEMLWIFILLDTNELSREEIVAKQLAHNSIQGYDDKEMLKRLFDEIKDVDLKLEAFIDPKDVDLPEPEKVPLLDITPDFDFKHVSLVFLPSQMQKFDSVLDRLNIDAQGVYAVPVEQFEKFKNALNTTRDIHNIKSVGMAVNKMCEIVEEYLKNDTKKD